MKKQWLYLLPILPILLVWAGVSWITHYQTLDYSSGIKVEGLFPIHIASEDLVSLELLEKRPEFSSAGGFALGRALKGPFHRQDGERVFIVAHHPYETIKLVDSFGNVYYYNTDNYITTQALYQSLANQYPHVTK